MFGILGKSLSTGVVTENYPATPPEISARARGKPEIDWANWKDARPATAICPTGAISHQDANGRRVAKLDLAKCIFCGLCAEVDKAIRMTNICECAARRREELATSATYSLKPDGSHERMISPPAILQRCRATPNAPDESESLETLGRQIKERANKIFGRSLHIREVDAGSCNGCEIEIVNLNSPVYDIERFGIHFVASPRHADMLLVTGPVTRNMELALRKTYDAMPDAATGRGRGRVRLQRRNFWRQLRDARRRGFGHSRGRLHSRLSAQSARAAARHSAGDGADVRVEFEFVGPAIDSFS